MSVPIPNARPDASWSNLRARLEAARHNVTELLRLPMFVCAVRGLFSRTIGDEGNDVNAYDDAFYLVLPQKTGEPRVLTFNGNTDPTRYGWNPEAEKYMARLKPGRYRMKRRLHGGRYWAFGQDGAPVTVQRMNADGTVHNEETGSFGIDLHPGGVYTTSSEGCLTLPPPQYKEIEAAILKAVGKNWWELILMDA